MNKTFIDFLNEVKEKLPNVVEEEIICPLLCEKVGVEFLRK